MDDALMNRKTMFFSLVMLLPVVSLAASDASLPDPTRPAIAEPKVVTGSDGEAPAALVLQSIILRKGKKSGAVINGQMVEVGQEILGARLTRVTETEVTLASESGKEILRLTPAVEKKPVVEKSNAKPMVSTRKQSANKALQ